MMRNARWVRSAVFLVAGAVLGAALASAWDRATLFAQKENPGGAAANPQADLAHLQEITPPNSHPMVDVAMFAANLWFRRPA